MAFEFRDSVLAIEERDRQFKRDMGTVPCVTCTAAGLLTASLSAEVDGEPDRIWVRAYGDSIPFIAFNGGSVTYSAGISVVVGYAEWSSERVILGRNHDVQNLADTTTVHKNQSNVGALSIRGNFPTLKLQPGTGLNISILGFSYYRYGKYEVSGAIAYSLSSLVPASGYERWVLIYLDQVTSSIMAKSGPAVLTNSAVPALKPDAPPDAYVAGYVKLINGVTQLLDEHILDTRQFLTPHIVAGSTSNKIYTNLVIPSDFTHIRGDLRVRPGSIVTIEDGGRVVIM